VDAKLIAGQRLGMEPGSVVVRGAAGPDWLRLLRESELVEAPPHRAEIRFSLGARCPLPARGARKAVPLRNRRKSSETAQ